MAGKIHVGKWRESIIRALRTPISHPDHKSLSPLRGNRAGDVLASPVSRPVDINSTDRICAKVKRWTNQRKNFPLRFPLSIRSTIVQPLFCISSLKRNETNDGFAPFRLVAVPFHASLPYSYLLSSNPSNDSLSAPRLRHPYFSTPPFPGLVKLDEKFLPRARTHPSSHVSFAVRKSSPLSRPLVPSLIPNDGIENKTPRLFFKFRFSFRVPHVPPRRIYTSSTGILSISYSTGCERILAVK